MSIAVIVIMCFVPTHNHIGLSDVCMKYIPFTNEKVYCSCGINIIKNFIYKSKSQIHPKKVVPTTHI